MTSAQASGLMSDPGYVIFIWYVYLYLKQLKSSLNHSFKF